MTKDQIQSFINSYLSKQAEEGPAHEAAETPNAEMLEHAVGVGGEEQPHGTGPGGVDVEQILSQLSPEELQELIAQLTQGEGAPAAGGDDVADLSQNIESHLAQNPEAQVPGMEPEKAAALDFVKSAHYIEGFIKQALDYGLDMHQAVNMYDSALTTTVDTMKKEAGVREAFTGAKDYIKNKAKGVSEAAGKRLENLKEKGRNFADRADEAYYHTLGRAYHNPGRTAAIAAGAAGTAAGAGYLAGKSSDKKKEAAYFEDETYATVKEAAGSPLMLGSGNKGLKEKALTGYNILKDKLNRGVAEAKREIPVHLKKHKAKYIGGAAGAAGAAGLGYLASSDSDDEKKAAYFEGVFKQATAYGFSEEEAYAVAKEAADASMFQRGLQKAKSTYKNIADKAKSKYKNVADKAKSKYDSAKQSVRRTAASAAAGAQEHVRANKGKYSAGAGAAGGAAAGYLAGKSSDKEKKAAYVEGVFKQAMAYGFSEAEAVQFAQQAEASL